MSKILRCFWSKSARENQGGPADDWRAHPLVEDVHFLELDGLTSTDTIREISELAGGTGYSLLITGPNPVTLGMLAPERLIQVARDTGASWVYADYYDRKGDELRSHPLIDYQAGSLRDDFEFGPLLLLDNAELKKAVADFRSDYQYAGLYQLRLAMSKRHLPLRIQEFLYSVHPSDNKASGNKLFDYLDPGNREVQVEMEKAVTEYLKDRGAYLAPEFVPVSFEEGHFPVEASVIIPVKNRVRTIADAVESVMKQKTSFSSNLIVVDNHSTDGTTDLLKDLARRHDRLVHVIPERMDLGIGGCWNLGVHHSGCGKFAVQLDSDDLYSDEHTLAQMVAAFYEQQCAMVIGSYRMCNFQLEEIPPGVIDHREWTPENGRNNALRINGLGAPRAFYTPLLRELNIPNVSYGEDYAVGLAISRKHQIGRIYAPLYLCRRWEENSDASLGIEAMNRHNMYKDRLRTHELMARIRMNSGRT